MSGLLFLTQEDFYNTYDKNKAYVMAHRIPGVSLILFYSTQCVHCKTLIPIFKSLPGSVSGCQFGMVNIANNKNCVHMSKNTISPINYVPYIILYIGGKPLMRYSGPYELSPIQKFVVEVTNKLHVKQEFIRSNKTKGGGTTTPSGGSITNHPGEIPAYTIGKPLWGSRVCYLEMDDAYVVSNK